MTFRRRTDPLERRLRGDQAKAPNALVDEIVSTIDADKVPVAAARHRRPVVALVATAVMLGTFAAFGGVGLAAPGVESAASTTAQAFSRLVAPKPTPARSASKRLAAARAAAEKAAATKATATVATKVATAPTAAAPTPVSSRPVVDHFGPGWCEHAGNSSAQRQYCAPRVVICHRSYWWWWGGVTLVLPADVASWYLEHFRGDYLGACRRH